MQHNRFEQDGAYIVESDPIPAQSWASLRETDRHSRRARAYRESSGHDMKIYLMILGAIVLCTILWVSIGSLPGVWFFIGILAAFCAIVLLVCGVAYVVISVIRHATKADFYPVEENGAYLRNALGRVQPLAPMIAAPARVNKATSKVEITPVVPTLFDLLEAGEIAPGVLNMVMGYDNLQLKKGILQLVVGSWPGTHAIAGRGRSGKTRRVIGEIAQVLIGGGYVIVCDPHYAKADSLSRQLEPLAKYLRIARGDQEIIAASRDFLAEMTRRETSPNTQFSPWAIYYDEWARLMTTDRIEDEDRAVLVEVAESCSEQYAGFNGFCALISQAWTSETCGGTRIRRGLQSAFVHQISPEYAAFFFRARKWQSRADEIKRRECIYKNGDGEISEIVTLGIPDDTASRVAVYLMSIGMQAIDAPASATPLPGYQEPPRLREQSAALPLGLPAPLSPAQVDADTMEPLQYRAPASTSQDYSIQSNERENVIFLPEAGHGSAPEVERKRAGSAPEVQTEALRAIAKRLRAGETPNDVRKSLGITGGRAMQEVNEALRALGEPEQEIGE